jgi:amino acid adenylation domain-containing protein
MYNSTVILLDETAEKFGSKTAVTDGDIKISYTEYRNLAMNMGTSILKHFGALKKNRMIAVFLPKSVKVLISFMGILYSGNTYIPLDTSMPEKRLGRIFKNLSPELIITDSDHAEELKALGIEEERIAVYDEIIKELHDRGLIDNALRLVRDSDPVYIMYTSGSTGNPKGVVIPHRGVIDYVNWLMDTFAIDENVILGNQSPFYFDNTVLDIYACLKTGAELIIIPDVFFQFQAKVLEYLNEMKINFIFWVPTIYINLANTGLLEETKLPYLKQALFCGEVMPNKQLNVWRKTQPHVLYANLYGPTEITDVCTYYIIDKEFEDHEPLPIGRACRNMSVLILDEEGKEVQKGETGELCVLGSGISLGYYGEKELTENAFKQNPLNDKYEEKMYCTGDLVYEAPDGLIMFAGRKDSQIKHRGNRIELGEIETAAKSLEGVDNACVLYDYENTQIVLLLEAAEDLNLKDIKKRLLSLIPKYMLPQKIKIMEKFPYTANSKIDRVTLKSLMTEGKI